MQIVRRVSGLPRKVPAGCYVAHNFPCGDPQRRPGIGGFRIFLIRLEEGDVLPKPCKCGWAYKGGVEHYWSWKVKRGLGEAKRHADEAVAEAGKMAAKVVAGKASLEDAERFVQRAKDAVRRLRAAERREKARAKKKPVMKCVAVK